VLAAAIKASAQVIDGRTVAACVQQIADSRTRPPQDTEDVLSQLERDGLIESIAALRAG
jgi:DNA-binding IscR family transcriptional regulator